MRVIRTINDTIRLLFNPKTESLKLGDFLLVREGVHNFLGQITEIYDNKYNHEENVAKIKLIFKVGENNEILPYDNFTPSRECEIAKIKQDEIEKCINTGKETFKIGLNTKNKKPFECPVNFFKNNPVIFVDKSDESNCAFENLAPKLSKLLKVVVVDFTGSLNINGATKIRAIEDFKLSLNYDSLDYIWEKGLAQAKLETQAVLEDIFNELKCFVKETEEQYIPFPKFIKVIEAQYKQTPIVELKVLANRMKKYYIQGIFAKSKKEFDGLKKCISRNNITVIDLSGLKAEWMRDFLEYIIKQIDENAYLLLRLNENNSNADLINLLYIKKNNLNVVSSLSYGFKNMPKVMEFARNYILYQTFNPRRDFGFANFWAQSIDSSSYVLFGDDTKNFMFSIENANFDETKKQGKKEKLFIELDLELEEMTSVELEGSNFEFKDVNIQPRLKEEVELEVALNEDSSHACKLSSSDSDGKTNDTRLEDNANNELNDTHLNDDTVNEQNFDEDEDSQKEEMVPENELSLGLISEDELDFYENQDETHENLEVRIQDSIIESADSIIPSESITPYMIEAAIQNEVVQTVEQEPEYVGNEDVDNVPEESNQEESNTINENIIEPKISSEEDFTDVENETDELDKVVGDTPAVEPHEGASAVESLFEVESYEEAPETEDAGNADDIALQEEVYGNVSVEEDIAPVADTVATIEDDIIVSEALTEEDGITEEHAADKSNATLEEDIIAASQKDPIIIVSEKPILQIEDYTYEDEPYALNDGIQAAEEEAQNSDSTKQVSGNKDSEEVVESGMDEEVAVEVGNEDNFSLLDIAKKSIETRFDEVMSETGKNSSKNKLKINENVSIDLEKIKNNIDSNETTLPIFKTETDDAPDYTFSDGELVIHEKYGEGTILKVVKYSNKCLLQIDFKEVGKRLLDPKIAHIKPFEG